MAFVAPPYTTNIYPATVGMFGAFSYPPHVQPMAPHDRLNKGAIPQNQPLAQGIIGEGAGGGCNSCYPPWDVGPPACGC